MSKTVGCCVENSKLRVVHKSLILDAVKEGEEKYLEEVLGALKEKYKERENKVRKFACWVWSKLQCKTEEKNEDSIKAEKKDEKESERKEGQKGRQGQGGRRGCRGGILEE